MIQDKSNPCHSNTVLPVIQSYNCLMYLITQTFFILFYYLVTFISLLHGFCSGVNYYCLGGLKSITFDNHEVKATISSLGSQYLCSFKENIALQTVAWMFLIISICVCLLVLFLSIHINSFGFIPDFLMKHTAVLVHYTVTPNWAQVLVQANDHSSRTFCS